MNWPDERYVKLYVRDSLTWLSWPWQARAVFPSILRKLDGAGIIETGNLEPAVAVAMQIDFPVDVVRPGLDAILASETLRKVAGGLESPAFIAAQEARKTEALKKRDQRERVAAQRRTAQVAELRREPVPTPSRDVPSCPPMSPSSPTQPNPAQPEKHVRVPPAADVEALKAAWNETTSPPIARWQAGREKLAAAALKRRPLEQWREVFARIEASSFCRGADGGWVADIDWALRPEGKKAESALKVLEGAFDRGPPTRSDAPSKVMPSAVETSTQVTTGF